MTKSIHCNDLIIQSIRMYRQWMLENPKEAKLIEGMFYCIGQSDDLAKQGRVFKESLQDISDETAAVLANGAMMSHGLSSDYQDPENN